MINADSFDMDETELVEERKKKYGKVKNRQLTLGDKIKVMSFNPQKISAKNKVKNYPVFTRKTCCQKLSQNISNSIVEIYDFEGQDILVKDLAKPFECYGKRESKTDFFKPDEKCLAVRKIDDETSTLFYMTYENELLVDEKWGYINLGLFQALPKPWGEPPILKNLRKDLVSVNYKRLS